MTCLPRVPRASSARWAAPTSASECTVSITGRTAPLSTYAVRSVSSCRRGAPKKIRTRRLPVDGGGGDVGRRAEQVTGVGSDGHHPTAGTEESAVDGELAAGGVEDDVEDAEVGRSDRRVVHGLVRAELGDQVEVGRDRETGHPAPRARPSWTAMLPTPPLAPRTRSCSPARTRATSRSAVMAVVPTAGSAAAETRSRFSGLRDR